VTSYGIIAIRYTKDRPDGLFSSGKPDITAKAVAFLKDEPLEFLMICRRDSLSFIEFVRGKYNDRTYLNSLFQGMTQREHDKIRALTFDELWRSVWGSAADTHKVDHENSYRKYKALGPIGALLDANPTTWLEPEWGFPKGRRNLNESDLSGAIREFKEETNLGPEDIQLIQNIPPLVETFLGSNHVQYCHKYYLAVCKNGQEVAIDHMNPHMSREIGAIGWFSFDAALAKIRPQATEKRDILKKAYGLLKSLYPV
jgi:8-oxo-dGTP pyrophosphatase MutT (NUDIX family)